MQGQTPFPNPRRTFGLIWAAILCAPAIYTVIGHVVVRNIGKDPKPMDETAMTLGIALAALGVATLALGLAWPQLMLSKEKLKAKGSKIDGNTKSSAC